MKELDLKVNFLKVIFLINILWGALAPIIIAFFAMIFSHSLIFLIKDVVFYCSFSLIFFFPNKKILVLGRLKVLFHIILFLLFLGGITLCFSNFYYWQIYNIRQLLVPFLIIAFPYVIKIQSELNKELILFILKLVFNLIIIGGVFLIIDIWEIIDLSNYFNAKGIPTYSNGKPAMFFEPSMNYLERLVSTILDPISFGHIITAAFVSLFFVKSLCRGKRKLYLIVFLIGLFMTFSKGAIFQLIIAVFLFNNRLNIILRVIVPFIVLVLGFFLIDLKGIIIHFKGLYFSIINVNFFGHGLGLVGNYAKMFAEDLSIYKKMQISDTFIGSVLGQIGIIGLLVWLSFFYRYIIDVVRNKMLPGSIIIVSQLVISVLSENTLNFTSFFIPGLLAVLVNKYQLYENSNNRN
tara:strand:+ start:1819 stop:3039 length:1221 start_codon:yes stop_codon:yes gene_type:complete